MTADGEPTTALEVLQPGIGTTVQDRGRHGQRAQGLPLAGWLDALQARAANLLVGNPDSAAGLEMRGAGTVLRVRGGPLRLALAGAIQATWLRPDGTRQPLPAWQSATLRNGDVLQLGPAASGCACLALAGGLQLPVLLGARASFWRAGLPGPQGRPLAPGDLLPCAALVDGAQGAPAADRLREWRLPTPWPHDEGPIRMLWGPQDDHFTAEARATFTSAAWQATDAQDRMGLRLRGPALAHTSAAAADIASDGATPGTIQVPANGQPIVLLADCQTVGGYPKIATVITADLPRLAHLRPGARVQFAAVSQAQAAQALRARQQRWLDWAATRQPCTPAGRLDLAALYDQNLVSGLLRAEP